MLFVVNTKGGKGGGVAWGCVVLGDGSAALGTTSSPDSTEPQEGSIGDTFRKVPTGTGGKHVGLHTFRHWQRSGK